MSEPKKKAENGAVILPHPANATHAALPSDVMQELLSAAASKYTWAELDPLMTKVKGAMVPLHNEEGTETFQLCKAPQQ